jgi:hypothetical protein
LQRNKAKKAIELAEKIHPKLVEIAERRAADNAKEKQQPRKWALYLRVLDGLDCGASLGDLAETLGLASRQAARDDRDAALRVRDRRPPP